MTNGMFVTNWVLDKVKKDYAEDIALVVSHTTLRIDENEKTVSYFVPATERGFQFGRTFILDGEGFDIWGIGWERLERFADLEEYNITCLADGEVLYARTKEDAARFQALQKRQQENLSDKILMRKNALTAFEQARKIYLETLFANDSDVKMGVGYLLDYLAQAIAFSNLRYFKKAQIAQLEELADMERVPQGFPQMYLKILCEPDCLVQKKLCFEAIRMVQTFLEDLSPDRDLDIPPQNPDYQMLADWYGELSYTWLRIRRYADRDDAVKVYMWGIMLQEELNRVCEEFGMEKMQLMNEYRSDRLREFAKRADQLEKRIQSIITSGGGVIHCLSREDLLHEV